MSQSTITSFFNSRKRPATEDIVSSKNKIAHIDQTASGHKIVRKSLITKKTEICFQEKQRDSNETKSVQPKTEKTPRVTSGTQASDLLTSVNAFAKKQNASNIKNQEPSKSSPSNLVSSARKELSLGDIRKRLAGSSRLAELKASADRISKGIQQLKETTDKKNLKEFRSIDVEVPSRYDNYFFLYLQLCGPLIFLLITFPSKMYLFGFSPSKKSMVQNELRSPNSKATELITSERPLISPRKVVVSPIKSPSKV